MIFTNRSLKSRIKMKSIVACNECFKINHQSLLYVVDYFDDRKATLKCQHGHNTSVYISNEKFEILYASSIYAYHAGFYNECISTAMAALERLYEFLINVFYSKLLFGGCHLGIASSCETSFRKHLVNNSERQFGAFTMLFSLATHGEVYNPKRRDGSKKNKGIVSIRNKVIHQGMMTTPFEAKAFLELVFDEINSILKACSKHSDIRDAIEVVKVNIRSEGICDFGSVSICDAICINFLNSIKKTGGSDAPFLKSFERELDELVKRFSMISQVLTLNHKA